MDDAVDREIEREIAKVIEEFKRDLLTGKVELDFKDGKIKKGRKQISFLK